MTNGKEDAENERGEERKHGGAQREAATPRKRPGPVPGAKTRKYTVLLEEELGEWGKRQRGGLSELTRRLIQKEMKADGERSEK